MQRFDQFQHVVIDTLFGVNMKIQVIDKKCLPVRQITHQSPFWWIVYQKFRMGALFRKRKEDRYENYDKSTMLSWKNPPKSEMEEFAWLHKKLDLLLLKDWKPFLVLCWSDYTLRQESQGLYEMRSVKGYKLLKKFWEARGYRCNFDTDMLITPEPDGITGYHLRSR